MKACELCGKEFDENLSRMTCKQLSEIAYHHELISDSKDERYCSKACERKADTTRIMTGLEVVMGNTLKSRKRSADVMALDGGLGGTCSKMARDKVMIKHILEGNGNDPKLKADATVIEQEKITNRENQRRKEQKERIREAKERYRSRYGVDA